MTQLLSGPFSNWARSVGLVRAPLSEADEARPQIAIAAVTTGASALTAAAQADVASGVQPPAREVLTHAEVKADMARAQAS